ncbi:universal stress protein [Pontibacillus litoralis]|uniref:Universal stress protein n=1 Tax=Pontibacillus litoralis JSM 072002 TaxID=1385512 RepID=A0A0A5G2D6_9BACI|nr:universal stress protein [Pontibacillus litoralis]KGX85313.1 universal stress protein [Pontibacillus litoralis JSM 072002]
MYKHILLAADGSKHAETAAKHAAYLAKGDSNAKVTVVYVVDAVSSKHDVISSGGNGAYLEAVRHERIRPIEQILEEEGVTFEYKLLKGEPGPTINRFAKEEEMDVIVIGSRGLNAIQEMVLGSVSHKVSHGAPCPVMIVK